jgi:hypothetical protein
MIVGGESTAGRAEPYGEFLPADDARFREAAPIGVDDLLAVRGCSSWATSTRSSAGRTTDGGSAA